MDADTKTVAGGAADVEEAVDEDSLFHAYELNTDRLAAYSLCVLRLSRAYAGDNGKVAETIDVLLQAMQDIARGDSGA